MQNCSEKNPPAAYSTGGLTRPLGLFAPPASDREADMTDIKPAPKKSVALSGIVAGNTALCTVGRTGNDLHYRGYDILDIAETCEFEEIAFLLVHGKLPTSPSSPRTRASSRA